MDKQSSEINVTNIDHVNDELNAKILEPYIYLSQNGGKGFRPQLLLGFQQFLQIDDKYLKVISEVMEQLHTASLLIDDVEDNSQLRRGAPVAHAIYGVPMTINCANYVYFLALEKICSLNMPSLVEIFKSELINLHQGQGMELYWRDNNVCPTIEEYMTMIIKKTGGLLRMGIRMMQEVSNSTQDFIPLVTIIGKIYQIRDDYLNLQLDEYQNLKGFCEDLSEGKYSFPMIHSLKHDPLGQLAQILKKRTQDIELKKYAVSIMQKNGSFEYTKKVLTELCLEARSLIQGLGGSAILIKIIESLEKY